MKTGTGSAIRCIYASAQALLVAVPVPLFISPAKESPSDQKSATHEPAIQTAEVLMPGNILGTCGGCGILATATDRATP